MTFTALSKNRSAGSSVMKGAGNHLMPAVFPYLSRVTWKKKQQQQQQKQQRDFVVLDQSKIRLQETERQRDIPMMWWERDRERQRERERQSFLWCLLLNLLFEVLLWHIQINEE